MNKRNGVSFSLAKAITGGRYAAQGAIAATMYDLGKIKSWKQKRGTVRMFYSLAPNTHDRMKAAAETLNVTLPALSALAINTLLPKFEKAAAHVKAEKRACKACGK